MRRIIIITAMLVMTLSLGAFATDTRVLTMGENNMILLDEANIRLFPSRLYDYPNLVVGEFGTYSAIEFGAAKSASIERSYFPNDPEFKSFGAHWKFGSDNPWVLGTYFSNSNFYYPTVGFGSDRDLFPDFLDFPDFFGDNSNLMSNNRFDIFYSRQMGENILGVSFGKIHSSYQREDDYDAGSKAEQSYANYMFAVGMTMQGGLLDWSLGLDLSTFTDKNSLGVDLNKPSGGSRFHGDIRYFKNMNPTYTIIPHASFSIGKVGRDNYDGDVDDNTLQYTQEYKTTEFQAGCGIQATPATNVLMVLDFGIMMSKVKYSDSPANADSANPNLEDQLTRASMPYFRLGFDADVFSWFDVRFGAASYWDNEKYEHEWNALINPGVYELRTDITKHRYASNHTWVGGGFHFGRLHIDTQFNPDLFLRGFDFISGANEDMNWRLSTAYEF